MDPFMKDVGRSASTCLLYNVDTCDSTFHAVTHFEPDEEEEEEEEEE